MSAPSILVIEDSPSLQAAYQAMVRSIRHQVTFARTAVSGLLRFRSETPAVVLLNLHLPDRDGLDLLAELLALRPGLPVIGIVDEGKISKASAAMKAGACDFLIRPFDEKRLRHVVNSALTLSGTDAAHTGREVPDGVPTGFIGASPAMLDVYRRIHSAAPSMATVFITGESGTGKELCARAVHDHSNRADAPFVHLNCGAVPPERLGSDIFGHRKGAFSGAIADKPGAAALADGGTLFLDDICELDPSLQARLLRFLQTSTIQPVGGPESRQVDVRIICATRRDPQEAIRSGRFREDLFYRLHVVPIEMPPLRERGADIIALAEDALRRFAAEEGRGFSSLAPAVKATFLTRFWPGNVRQLLNVMRHVVVLNDGDQVVTDMLPKDLRDSPAHLADPAAGAAPDMFASLDALSDRPLAEIERLVIEHALDRTGGSIPRAAKVLEVAPSTLYRKIEGWRRA